VIQVVYSIIEKVRITINLTRDNSMFSKLSIKLLLPNIVIGLVFICSLFLIDRFESKFTFIAFFCGLIVMQSVTSHIFTRHILSKRLVQLKAYLDVVVSTEEAPSEPLKDAINDELGEVTNELSHFIEGLADVASVIRQESEVLREGSTQLSQQMSDSVKLVEDSAGKITLMAESIEDVANTSTSLSNSAEQVSETTSAVMETLANGVNSSNTSQETIEAVASEVADMSKELDLLQDESARIGSVLDVIRGIADQTNLLALNAAIEAARAGEQGRGFAVVADEVRALAHRTQESTVEIQSMVEGLQTKSTNAVNSINRGNKLTQDSLVHSGEVVSALEQIGFAFQEVDNLTSQIASSTLAQQSATATINDNMLAVVSLSHEINNGLGSVSAHAGQQLQTSKEVEQTISRICV